MENDSRFPDSEERNLIANGVLITKVIHSPTDIRPIYHRWRDVWEDKLMFAVVDMNPNMHWRAVAITLPMYHLDDAQKKEFLYRGYVVGLDTQNFGDIQIFPVREIRWL
jgi:hypothetical protein